eukprot:gene5306-8924_t
MSLENLPDVTSNINPENKKIVILFGWSGSTQKLLSKYAQIYQERKMSTIQMVAHLKIDRDAKSVDPFLKAIEEKFNFKNKQEEYSVYFHVMSNGGLFNYMKALKLMETTDEFKHWKSIVKGVVFDSCPGDLTITTYATVLTTYIDNTILKNIAWLLVVFGMLFWALFSICFSSLRVSAEKSFVEPMKKSLLHDTVPLLIIYSEKDHLIDCQYINKFIIKLTSFRKLVSSKLFKDSDHNIYTQLINY